MADFIAIQQLLNRYCFAHDSQDPVALAKTFSKNAELMGITGRDEIAARYGEGYKHLTKRRRHTLSNFILLEDGEDRAVMQTYITLYLIENEQITLHLTGVYRDTVVLEDGEWLIQTREATMDVPYNPGDTTPAAAGHYTQDDQKSSSRS